MIPVPVFLDEILLNQMVEVPFEGTPGNIECVCDDIRFRKAVLKQIEQDIPGRFSTKDGDLEAFTKYADLRVVAFDFDPS